MTGSVEPSSRAAVTFKSVARSDLASHIDTKAVGAFLAALPGVTAVHDLHIWGMSTTDVALTAHLVRPALEGEEDDDAFLLRASRELRTRFGIAHPTLQIERGRGPHSCDLLPCVGA